MLFQNCNKRFFSGLKQQMKWYKRLCTLFPKFYTLKMSHWYQMNPKDCLYNTALSAQLQLSSNIKRHRRKFIKCRIPSFMIMECCRCLKTSRIFMAIYLFLQFLRFTDKNIKPIENISKTTFYKFFRFLRVSGVNCIMPRRSLP